MRVKAFAAALAAAIAVASIPARPAAMGRPGVTPVPCPTQQWELSDAAFEALPGAKTYSGTYDGGLYRIEIPEQWNGDLVLYAHGFVSNAGTQGSSLRVQNHPIREHLIREGFAWAASSYRCNGYVPGMALVDTMALVDLFKHANGGRAPQRTYLTGTSMGGHVTLLGMQEFPTSFAGGLAMCPAGPELFDYFAAVSAAAEVISGVQFRRDSLQADAAKIAAMMGKPPDYTDKGRQLASVEIAISGGPRPFAMEGLASRFIANFSTSPGALVGIETPGNRALTNTHITYSIDESLGLTAEALNRQVRRKPADPEIRNADGPYEEVVPFDGKIERPTLTMHGTGDLFVPVFLEQSLKRAVAAAGNGRLLVQRLYRIGAHCQFSRTEQIRAFDDLVKWVRAGVRPDGDDVNGDLSDAGRKFTDPLRPNDPGGISVTSRASSSAQAAAREGRVDFVRDVQPIFRASCIGCHGPSVQQSGFRLDRRSAAMRGGTISVIGAGNSLGSRLYQKLIGNDYGPQMPPTGALPPDEIATIKAWIDQGAEWPDSAAGEAAAPPPDERAVRLMEAIRRGDRQTFRRMASIPGIGSARGEGGTTPLMFAVLHGTAADVRLLLEGGADPNAANDVHATALMWAAAEPSNEEKVRLLIEGGANVNAKSDDGRTPLLIASGVYGNSAIARMLLDHGAGTAAMAPLLPAASTNALGEAARAGDARLMQLLIERGADINGAGPVPLVFALRSQCQACIDLLLPRTAPPLVTIAMVVSGPPGGPALATSALLARGADPNASDPAGRSMLMLAAASDAMPTDAIKALLDRGANLDARGPGGETAIGLAIRHGSTPVVDLLTRAGATPPTPPKAAAPTVSPPPSVRAAVERVLPLLQQNDVAFLKKTGCVSCHNNSLTAMTVAAAQRKRIETDQRIAQGQATAIAVYLEGWRERALQNHPIPGDVDTISYILLGLGAAQHPADAATEAMARYLVRQQTPDGFWRIFAHRPPIESSNIQVTAVVARALQLYAPVAEKARFDQAVAKAARWLEGAQARTTEERTFQLLAFSWLRASRRSIGVAARALAGEQRSDGGWAQLPSLAADAYATGQALVALAESGAMPPTDPVFARGVQFLLRSQQADGTWHVPTRAIPLQPHFESGFPYGRDQFISAAATNWAAQALIHALKPAS